MEIHKVSDVFTPTREDPKAFVERKDVSSAVKHALSIPNKQIVISGPVGSGKSTLLFTCAKELNITPVRVNCDLIDTMQSIINRVVEKLKLRVLDSEEYTQANEVGGKVGLSSLVGIQGKTGGSEKQVFKLPIPSEPSFSWLAEKLIQSDLMWVIDDFHKLKPEIQDELFGKVKIFINTSNEYPANNSRMVLLGAAKTSINPLLKNPDLRNRITSVELELMTDEEIYKIITKGESLLNITIPVSSKKRIVQLSCGIPSVCHSLCFNLCLAAGIQETQENSIEVNGNSLEQAINGHYNENLFSFKEIYEVATVRKRVRKYDNAKLILTAIAQLESYQVTHEQVLEQIHLVQPNYPPGNLSIYLRELTEESRGAVLRYNANTRKYSFVDPFFKSFIRSQH